MRLRLIVLTLALAAGSLLAPMVAAPAALAATCGYPAVQCPAPTVPATAGQGPSPDALTPSAVAPSGAPSDQNSLAFTGYDAAGVAALAVVLAGLGLLLVRVSRRRA